MFNDLKDALPPEIYVRDDILDDKCFRLLGRAKPRVEVINLVRFGVEVAVTNLAVGNFSADFPEPWEPGGKCRIEAAPNLFGKSWSIRLIVCTHEQCFS